ncbi:MAG: DUF6364 family protein [Halobacteria archaeon]
MAKAKLTLTVDPKALARAKRASRARRIPLSRLVEGFLDWASDPRLHCFACSAPFGASRGRTCAKCGWLSCPSCGGCGCALPKEALAGLHSLRKTLEELAGGRLAP